MHSRTVLAASRCVIAAFVTGALLIGGMPPASAVTADEAKAFLEKAVAHVKDVGEEKAFAEFTRTDNEYHQGELYIFCFAPDGMSKAHGGNAKFVGTNMMNVRDADGFESTAAIIKVAMEKGAGWTDIKWPNPATKKVEKKGVYSIRIGDDTVCATGYYKG